MKGSIKQTRMELLNTKQRLALASKGHKILKQKRDALVLEFFGIVKKAANLRGQVDAQVKKANRSLAIATASHGEDFMQVAALSAKRVPEVEVSTKNIMGVRIPVIKGVSIQRSLTDRGYSIAGSSAKFDEAVADFEEAVNLIIKLAETESALRRLLKEIEKTNRRVNALEFNIQPEMKEIIRTIGMHLTMLESEQFVALKTMKRKLQKQAEVNEK
ncbi:V-type ATP synthase subunit D [Candidatus Norongarragalina meridionalis]|nr:V-type ATP synthase subunit D [Candidatus Norongarragalina meridionalis]